MVPKKEGATERNFSHFRTIIVLLAPWEPGN